MTFSRRSGVDRTENAIARAIAVARAAGRPLVDLTVGNPTDVGLGMAPVAVLAPLGDARSLRYEPAPFGLPDAREAVAADLATNGIAVSPERIVLTASTSEAYSFLLHVLCDAGDEVLAPVPSYPLFDALARVAGVRLVPYRLAYDGAWHVDLDSVRRARTDRTRAILCVSPNNPTGSYLSLDELAALGALGLPIVSDEVFARYPLRPGATRATTALAGDAAPLVFALSGLSKLAALPQMKVAWIAAGGADGRLVDESLARIEIVADAFLSVATPQQHALASWLAAAGPVRERIRERCAHNLAALRAGLAATAATVLDVEGGWYATIRLPATRTDEAWVLALLERGVLVQPGYFYDFEDGAYIVLSLISAPDETASGAVVIAACIAP